jgi:hypothetical protein
MRKIAIALIAVAAASAASIDTGNAQSRRWCSQGHIGGGFPYCGYDTLQQCLATVSGLGKTCTENWRDYPQDRKKQQRQQRNYYNQW